MNHTSECLTAESVSRLRADDLSPAELDQVEHHLDECSSCRALLDTAAAEPAAWAELRFSLSESSLAGHEADDVPSIEHVLKLLGPTDDPRMLGRIGPYEIVGVLGRGGMGVVFKGFDAALNRYVAIKMLQPHVATWGAARERFAREARAAAAVVDENVMAIHGVAEWQGLPYFVMPYTRGISLQKRLHDTGPLQLREILRIGMQTASGLAAAHGQGLVHRDVKPANILLADGVERVTLSDFGLARAVDDASVTLHGVVAGTPQYMSPEQARGQSVDSRSDLFSLGSVLYALSTGRPPFRAESTLGVLRLVIEEEPQPIRELNPDIPEWLCRIIARLMAKRPENRYQSAREVAELLEKCLAHVQQPTAMPLPAELIAASQPGRAFSRKAIVMIAAFGICVLGLLAWQVTTPPDIAGEWQGDEWGRVTLKATGEGEYTGTYTDTFGQRPGEIRLTWSRIERRYSGTWREGDDRVGEISVRLVAGEVHGAWTADPKSKINPNTPHLADLLWTRPQVVARSPDRATATTAGLPGAKSGKPAVAASSGLGDPRTTGSAAPPAATLIFRTHQKDAVTTLRFSPDGMRLAANNEHDFALFDARTGKELWSAKFLTPAMEAAIEKSNELRARPREVRTLGFSPDGAWLVAGHNFGQVMVFHAESGSRSRSLSDKSQRLSEARAIGCPWSLSVSPDGKLLAVCGESFAAVGSTRDLGLRGDELGLFKVFDVETGELKLDLLGHSSQGLDVAFSPDGKLLATAGNWSGPDAGSGVKLWDPQTGELKRTIPVEHTALSLAFSPSGDFLAIGTLRNDKATGLSQGNIYLVRPASGRVELVVRTPIGIRPLSFSPDGKLLAASSAKNAVALWDVNTGKQVGEVRPTQTAANVRIEYFAFAPSGLSLAIGGMDPQRGGFIEVWSISSPPPAATTTGDQGAAAPNNDAPAPADARAKPLVLLGHSDWVTGVAFSPDGKRLTSSSRDNTLKVWDAVTGQEQFIAQRSGQNILDGHRGYVESVAFSPDGKYLASVGDDHAVYLWSASTGRCAGGWLTHKHIVLAVAYSPDGKRLATASADNTVKVWDANPDNHRGGEILSLEHSMPLSVAFSPDNQRLASAGRDNIIRVWNPVTAELLLTIKHADQITCVVFSPDGTRLASAGPTGVQQWDAATGKQLGALPDLTGISGVAYSPSGKRLATSGWDHVVRLWDATTGQQLLELKGHGNSVGRLAFSPDGKRLASASHDRTVRIWDVTLLGDESPGKPSTPPKQVRITKEQVDRIKESIKDAPVTTSYLAEIWELVPGTQAEYRVRKDITAVELLSTDVKHIDFLPAGNAQLNFVPLGTAYITVSRSVYLQWDDIGASTRHYYGPFYGDKLKQIGIDLEAAYLPMQ